MSTEIHALPSTVSSDKPKPEQSADPKTSQWIKQTLKKSYALSAPVSLPLSERKLQPPGLIFKINQGAQKSAQISDHPLVEWRPSERLPSLSYGEKFIVINDLFPDDAKQNYRQLIEGRASVDDQTAVSRYLAWQWSKNDSFKTPYDYILWISLPQWLGVDDIEFTQSAWEEHLAKFIYDQHIASFAQEATPEDKNAYIENLKNLLTDPSSNTLLLLDNFDVVAKQLTVSQRGKSKPSTEFLRKVLQHPYIILTTRDYQLPPSEFDFDRRLITLGLNDLQLRDYIEQFMSDSDVSDKKSSALISSDDKPATISPKIPAISALETELRKNDTLWRWAHIPLNLAFMCSFFGNRPKELHDLYLHEFYQQVEQEFWRHHLNRQARQLPENNDLAALRQSCLGELEMLRQLAWQSFLANQPYLSIKLQQHAFSRALKLPSVLDKSAFKEQMRQVFNSGFLQTKSGHNTTEDPLAHEHCFIHKQLQEYFAADYLCEALQGKYGKEFYTTSIAWISRNKYYSHSFILLGLVAALSTQPGYKTALKAFWAALLAPPHDWSGQRHLHLMIHCLEQARIDVTKDEKEGIPEHRTLLREIREWFEQLKAEPRSLSWRDHYLPWFMPTLHASPHLLSQTRLKAQLDEERKNSLPKQHVRDEKLLEIIKEDKKEEKSEHSTIKVQPVIELTVKTQSPDAKQSSKPPAHMTQPDVISEEASQALKYVVAKLQDDDQASRIDKPIKETLDQLEPALLAKTEILKALPKALESKAQDTRELAVEILFILGKSPETSKICQDLKISILAKPFMLEALPTALASKATHTRQLAVDILCRVGNPAVTLKILEVSVIMLHSENPAVRMDAITVLRKFKKIEIISDAIEKTLLNALSSKEKTTQHYAIEILRNFSKITITPETQQQLLQIALQADDHKKDDLNVCRHVAIALRKLNATKDAQEPLLKRLKDEKETLQIQKNAVEILGYLGVATPDVLETLLKIALQTDNYNLCRYVAIALRRLSAGRTVKDDVLKRLKDEKETIQTRKNAVEILGHLGIVTPDVSDALINAVLQVDVVMEDKSETPEAKTKKDATWVIRRNAAHALGRLMTRMTDFSPIERLIELSQNRESKDRMVAIEALGNLGETLIAEKIVGNFTGEINELKSPIHPLKTKTLVPSDKTESSKASKRHSVIEEASPDSAKPPQPKTWYRRVSEFLGEKPDILSKILHSLNDALIDTDSSVEIRARAAESLGKLTQAPNSSKILDSLITILKKPSEPVIVRIQVIKALRKLATPATMPKIMQSLFAVSAWQDQDPGIRREAIDVLLNFDTIATPQILQCLFDGLKDKNPDVCKSADYVLNHLKDLVPNDEVMGVLINALNSQESKESDSPVRRHAIKRLMKLSPTAITPEVLKHLLNCLIDDNENVRKLATQAIALLTPNAAPDLFEGLFDGLFKFIDNMSISVLPSEIFTILVGALGTPGESEKVKRRYAADTLAGLKSFTFFAPKMQKVFVNALQDEDDNIRYSVIKTLGNAGKNAATAEILDGLMIRLWDKPFIAYEVMVTLQKMGVVSVTDVIKQMYSQLKNHASDVTKTLDDCLLNPAGLSYYDIACWRALYDTYQHQHPDQPLRLRQFSWSLLWENYVSTAAKQARTPTTSELPNPWADMIAVYLIAPNSNVTVILDGNHRLILIYPDHSLCLQLTEQQRSRLPALWETLQKRQRQLKLPELPTWQAMSGRSNLYEASAPVMSAAQTESEQETSLAIRGVETKAILKKIELINEDAFRNFTASESRFSEIVNQWQPMPMSNSSSTTHQDGQHNNELRYMKQRKLLDEFLRNVKSMAETLAKGFLRGLSPQQRRNQTSPQVFISYAWEAKHTPRLKHLQEIFLRDTFYQDLRHAGLNPWLDINDMTGFRDGQMRDNIQDSQFALLIGTERYGELIKTAECGLLYLPPGSAFKAGDSVTDLPVDYHNFYLRVDEQLFYISDKHKNEYFLVDLKQHPDRMSISDLLNAFDQYFKIDLQALKVPNQRLLTEEDLNQIVEIIYHERRNNVRKEFEFALAEAKKSNDFLLPLLLEGEEEEIFHEISGIYKLRHGRNWFSFDDGRWLDFGAYITTLTQTSSPLGILPTLLGLARHDHYIYREALKKNYRIYEELLKKSLEEVHAKYPLPSSASDSDTVPNPNNPENSSTVSKSPTAVSLSHSATPMINPSIEQTTTPITTTTAPPKVQEAKLLPKPETKPTPLHTPLISTNKMSTATLTPVKIDNKNSISPTPEDKTKIIPYSTAIRFDFSWRSKDQTPSTSNINGSVLLPGHAQLCLALHTKDIEKNNPLIYIETVSKENKLTCTEYKLSHRDNKLGYTQKEIDGRKISPKLLSEYEFTAFELTLEQSKKVSKLIIEKNNLPFRLGLLNPYRIIDRKTWEVWCMELYANATSQGQEMLEHKNRNKMPPQTTKRRSHYGK